MVEKSAKALKFFLGSCGQVFVEKIVRNFKFDPIKTTFLASTSFSLFCAILNVKPASLVLQLCVSSVM